MFFISWILFALCPNRLGPIICPESLSNHYFLANQQYRKSFLGANTICVSVFITVTRL
jgi:hypothetical protein